MSSLLDKIKQLRKEGTIESTEKSTEESTMESEAKQQEEDTHEWQLGDKKREGPFELTYSSEKKYEMDGYGSDACMVHKGYVYGWAIRYVDPDPAKDVVMPDVVDGIPILSARHCFEGTSVASVAHISAYCIERKDERLLDMFKNSGLREIPEQLMYKRQSGILAMACAKAYLLPELPEINENSDFADKDFCNYYEAKKILDKLQKVKQRDVESVDGEFSAYTKVEKVSFVYNFHPVSIIRIQDSVSGKWFALAPECPVEEEARYYATPKGLSYDTVIVPYDEYMARYENDKIQGLTVDSFTSIPLNELKGIVEEIYDEKISKYTEVIITATKNIEHKVATAKEKFDKLQEGLNFVPKQAKPKETPSNETIGQEAQEEENDERE